LRQRDDFTCSRHLLTTIEPDAKRSPRHDHRLLVRHDPLVLRAFGVTTKADSHRRRRGQVEHISHHHVVIASQEPGACVFNLQILNRHGYPTGYRYLVARRQTLGMFRPQIAASRGCSTASNQVPVTNVSGLATFLPSLYRLLPTRSPLPCAPPRADSRRRAACAVRRAPAENP